MKWIAELALMAWLGRAAVGVLAGGQTRVNPFWRLLDWLVAPFERRAGRWTVPLLVVVWLLATALKLHTCLAMGVAACR